MNCPEGARETTLGCALTENDLNFICRNAANSAKLFRRSEPPPGFPGRGCFLIPKLFQFEGAGVELIVGALLGNQIVVGAPLDDPAVIQNHDAVGVADGA